MTGHLDLKQHFNTNLLLLALASLTLAALPAHAQDIADTWQGTLQVGEDSSRIVLKISKSDSGALKVDSYDLNSGALRVPVNNVTFDGSTLKFPLTGHSGNYVGKMSADGNTIVGAWKQEDNDRPAPLTFTRATPETAWKIPAPALTPMAVDAHPSFEVATIKPSTPGESSNSLPRFFDKGRYFTADNVSLLQLIEYAYQLQPRQILDAPAWADITKFDIVGVPDIAGQPNGNQESEMYRKLLADRFKLSFHRGKKEFSVYALKQEKVGVKLTKSSGDPNEPPRLFGRPGARGDWTITCANYPMKDFVSGLTTIVKDRQVVDQTGLKDRYDFHLTYALDPLAPDAGATPDIFHAVQQQLGLKLESTKAPVDVIVIDHVEQPTAN